MLNLHKSSKVRLENGDSDLPFKPGSVKAFILGSLPKPQYVADLEGMGWVVDKSDKMQNNFQYSLKYPVSIKRFGPERNGFVKMISQQVGATDEVVFTLYDFLWHQSPMEVRSFRWPHAKKALEVWQRSLKRQFRPSAVRHLGDFHVWRTSWQQLDSNLNLVALGRL